MVSLRQFHSLSEFPTGGKVPVMTSKMRVEVEFFDFDETLENDQRIAVAISVLVSSKSENFEISRFSDEHGL